MNATAQVSRLHVSQPEQRSLAPDQVHSYALSLEEGQYVHLVADQFGVDVELRLLDPAGNLAVRRDSLTGARGEEAVHAVAGTSGEFFVEVAGLEIEGDEPHPTYGLRIEALHSATAQDRARAVASYAFGREDFERAVTAWSSVGDSLEEAKSRFRLADRHQQNDQLDAAFQEFRAARELFRQADPQEVGARRIFGTVVLRLSELHLKRRESQDALNMAEQAAEIFQAVGPKESWCISKIRIGIACQWLDRTEEGMLAAEDVSELAQELEDRELEIWARRTLAQFHYQRDALDASRREWQRVKDLAIDHQDLDTLRVAQHRLIRLLVREDRFEEAREPLEAALEEATVTPLERLALIQDAVELYLGIDQLDPALEWIETGLALSRDRDDEQYEAVFLHLLGRRHYALGNYRDALDLQDRARRLYRKVGDRQGEVSAQYVRAQSLYALDRHQETATLLESLLESAESLRAESLSHDLRASYMGARRHYWELYVDALMRLHDASPEVKFDEIALEAGEQARARSLYEQLLEAEARSRAQQSSDLRARRREVREVLQTLELGAPRRATHDGATTESLNARRTKLLEELDRLDREMRAAMDLPEIPPELSISELQQEISRQRRTHMLVYFLGQHRAYAWWISPDGVESHPLEASPGEIERTAREWAKTLPENYERSRQKRRTLGIRLGELLLKPFADKIPGGRLVVVPDGALHALPFSALTFPIPTPEGRKRYVAERNEIIQIPSASVLRQLRRRDSEDEVGNPSVRQILVLADPRYSPDGHGTTSSTPPALHEPVLRAARNLGKDDLEPLHRTRDEAHAIQETARAQGKPCRILLGSEARKSAVLGRELGKLHALHFATHGLVDSMNPDLSGVVLSLYDEDGRPVDGHLRLHELYDMRLDARLVVLSACETGIGREIRGEGLISLTRGFFYAGVPRVIASLWSVNDLSTAELMSRFYRFHLENRLLPSSALNAAQRSMIEDPQWNEPYHWAPFVFQGDWSIAADLGDDPIGGVAVEPPDPNDPDEPAGDSEVPFFLSGVDNGDDDEDDDEEDAP